MILSKNEFGFLVVGLMSLIGMLPFVGLMHRPDFPGTVATLLVNTLGVTGGGSIALFATLLTIRLCRRKAV